MKPPRPGLKHGYAIVRVDDFQDAPLQNKITVKKVVWDAEEAKKEVERLNLLNTHAVYFYQITRVEEPT